jgi:hypothetical protein
MADEGFWVEALQAGTFTDMHGTKVTFTESDLDRIVSAFEATKDTLKPPVRLGTHNPLGIAGGWIGGMRRVGTDLQVQLQDLLPGIKEMFEKKLYRTVSAGVKFGKEVAGHKWAMVMDHLAVLGEHLPAIKTLKDIQALMSEEQAKAYDLPAVEDEVHVFEVFQEEEENTMADEHKVDAKAFDNLLERFSALEVKLSEATTAQSEAAEKLAAEKTRADEAEKKLEMQKVELAEKASKASMAELTEYCDAKVKDMKMSPKAKDALLKDVQVQFSESGEALIPWSAVKAFTEAGGLAPKGEQGGAGDEDLGDPKDVAKELDAKVVELMEKHEGLDYSTAARRVYQANPELAKAHQALYEGGN